MRSTSLGEANKAKAMTGSKARERFFIPFLAIGFGLFLFLGIAHSVHHLGKEGQAARECPVYKASLQHQSFVPIGLELPADHSLFSSLLLVPSDAVVSEGVWPSPPGRSPPSSLI
ncbi:MAG: hypothetical protein ACK4Z6_08955 [Candidatus Methylomirabilales bacterium]